MSELLTLKSALSYAANHLPIIPLLPGTKIPCKTSTFSNGFHSATTNQDHIINHWNQEQHVSCNIGLKVGKETGIVILDIDVHQENGFESLDILEAHFESLPETFVVDTPSGGRHYYFSYPPNITIQRQVNAFKGIDILVDGYVLAVPSHIDGKPYKIVSGNLAQLAEFPSFLLDALEVDKTNHSVDQTVDTLKMQQDTSVTQGKMKYTATFLKEMVEGATTGGRNDFLMRFTAKCLALGVPLEIIYTLLLVVNENFVDVSLPESEINTLFKSITKKHLKNVG